MKKWFTDEQIIGFLREAEARLLSKIAVDEVWGGGRRISDNLCRLNIRTVRGYCRPTAVFPRSQG